MQAPNVVNPAVRSAKPFIVRDSDPIISRCEFAACVNNAVFVGVQCMYGAREDVGLFQRRPGASTIALPLSKVSPLGLAYAFVGQKFVEAGK
jgi:hypothetical protein